MRAKPTASYRSELLPCGREIALSFDGLIGLQPWLALWLKEWARRFPRAMRRPTSRLVLQRLAREPGFP